MSYSCKILLDSISETGKRITTFELTYPRMIHSEFMTHRMFSRNAASSRAIPAKKMRQMVNEDCYTPDKFPKNVAGMQPAEWYEQDSEEYFEAKKEWKIAADNALIAHENLERLGIHKQIANRLIEPFLWYTCIVTATEFSNFFKLRCDENAQYEIRRIADLMYEAYHNNECYNNRFNQCDKVHTCQQNLKIGEWHCPLVYEEDDECILRYLTTRHYPYKESTIKKQELEVYALSNHFIEIKKQISVARCARVSYLTHDGKRDIEKDLELFERLKTSGHFSPFEHVATPSFDKQRWNQFQSLKANQEEFEKIKPINLRNGNFIGWRQMRQDLPNENCTNFRK